MPEDTHVILIFDCCRGSGNVEMNPSATTSTSFQLTVRPSQLGGLKNRDFKNSYIFHATLPNQVVPLPVFHLISQLGCYCFVYKALLSNTTGVT